MLEIKEAYETIEQIIHSYNNSLSINKMSNIMNRDMYKEFPKNISRELKSNMFENLGYLFMTFNMDNSKQAKKQCKDLIKKIRNSKDKNKNLSLDLVIAILRNALIDKVAEKDHIKIIGELFIKQSYFQEITILIAYIEALIGDSIKIIIQLDPNALKQQKTITWNEVLSFENKEELVKYFADDFSNKLGKRNLIKLQ